jgi:hypothetical protein
VTENQGNPIDLHQQVLAGQFALKQRQSDKVAASCVSGLSVVEVQALASIGWEPIDLVCGASVFGLRRDTVNKWGAAQDRAASVALGTAMETAADRLEVACAKASCFGAVAVDVTLDIAPLRLGVNLVGTAIRPVNGTQQPSTSFSSNLSTLDFVRLYRGGWIPVGLASGCSFARAPRRGPGDTLVQTTQNVEFRHFTDAFIRAREAAMEQLRNRANSYSGDGVVQVSLSTGPVPFAPRVMSFVAWGTVIRKESHEHVRDPISVAVELNDLQSLIEATSLAPEPSNRRAGSRHGK